ncbi:major facilitator superfamily domain-containing protein [Truncatella angustata]|uniref:Major facilitator superfamily domain-containing protein n=1 Tax=Truncatella angustata TaxID=152316 RepID=A0A9P8UMP0_9PEZI|nr:major facilitator superfamily domain-containing protein [Truncatella angustata]KAH6654871.1 major facilitator superfamily domain-containing protein [Truncatella angustata]
MDASTSLSIDTIDADIERRLVRKIDLYVYPILFVIYMLSFLDRINISNGRIQGLADDIDLSGNRFNIALFIYFVPYVLLEVPSNMIIQKVRPSLYLSGLMFSWGITNMCMGFVRSYEGLVALRFLLGATEAGVLPGIIYLTSMYYKRHEFQIRMSFLFCSTLAGGAFGGLLAYAIADLSQLKGYLAWRWIFIIEGATTSFVAIISAFLIVDWPEQCRFLSPEEKVILKRRLADDGAGFARMDTLDRYAYKLIFSDWKIWLGSIVYMGIGTTGYATTFFMPTILNEFGWKAEEAQVRTIPIYAVSAVGMLLVAYLSDRLRHRYGFILLGCLIATVGYGMLLNQAMLSQDAKFAAIFLVSLGGYMCTPIALAWLSNNVSGHWKRAISSGVQVMIGNFAGIIGANIFVPDEAPTYATGYGTSLAMLWLGGLAATAMFIGLWLENRKRAAGKRDYRLALPDDVVKNMGDDHPSFRFTL